MAGPTIAQRSPFRFDVTQGKSYWRRACGRRNSQPFCDGSHKGSELSPIRYDATDTRTVSFCGCKHSGGRPFRDGTHSRLP